MWKHFVAEKEEEENSFQTIHNDFQLKPKKYGIFYSPVYTVRDKHLIREVKQKQNLEHKTLRRWPRSMILIL